MNDMTEHNEAPRRRSPWKKIRNIVIAVLILGGAAFFAIRFYYPFATGVKTGQLNFVVYKGVFFKTYEGRLIQSGFRTEEDGGIQSNEFNFSIVDKQIADSLMHVGGQIVELRYKEYFGALPWRGYSKYIVSEIVSIAPVTPGTMQSFPVVTPQ